MFFVSIPLQHNHNENQFGAKKAIRIITNCTTKVDGKFQHTKPLFQKAHIMTLHNLYFYFVACEAKKIICSKIPTSLFRLFEVSDKTKRLILPKFKKEMIKSNSFVFNSSKILNYFKSNKINYYNMPLESFKAAIRRFLMIKQSISVNNDPNWLPLNTSIFTDVVT